MTTAGELGRLRVPHIAPPAMHRPICPRWFPPDRYRPEGAEPAAVPKYERIDGPNGETTLGDSDAIVWTFSGVPDLIVLSARTNGALVKLTDRLNRETSPLTVLPGQPVYIYVGRERVTAKNLVPGSNSLLSVTGFWAEYAELGSGRYRS
jgi:hypothetical protein